MIRSNMLVAAALIVGATCAHAQTDAVPRIVMEDIQSTSGRLEFQALMLIEEEFLPQSARIIDLDASSLIARLVASSP